MQSCLKRLFGSGTSSSTSSSSRSSSCCYCTACYTGAVSLTTYYTTEAYLSDDPSLECWYSYDMYSTRMIQQQYHHHHHMSPPQPTLHLSICWLGLLLLCTIPSCLFPQNKATANADENNTTTRRRMVGWLVVEYVNRAFYILHSAFWRWYSYESYVNAFIIRYVMSMYCCTAGSSIYYSRKGWTGNLYAGAPPANTFVHDRSRLTAGLHL